MSNRVRGPTSALSSFLREKGIRVPENPYRRQRSQDEAQTGPSDAAAPETVTGSATDAPEVSTQEVTLDQSVGQEDQEPSARETQAEIEESTAPAKGKAKKKPAPAKKQKRKKDEDDDDEFESDEGVFATKKVAPRSGHSKRRKTENADRGGVKFCSRCLRRYIPKESEAICHACSSIQGGRKSGIGKKRGKVIINEDGVRVAVMSLKDLCIKLLADLIEDVEQFGDISDSTRRSISRIISKHRKLNNGTLQLFLDPQEDRLELFDCTLITADGYNMVGIMGANLRFLTLQMCGKITDTELKHLSDRCTQVQELDLDGPFLCSDDGLKSLFELPLKSLRIAHAEKMTGASLEELVLKCSNLQHLSLEYCGRLKDGAQVVSGLGNLKSLSLNHIGGMTNESLMKIIESVGGNLKLLSLNGCNHMSDEVLVMIAKECPNLADLSLSDAPALTGQGFSVFFTASKAHFKSFSIHRNVTLPDSVIISLVNQHGSALEVLNLNGLDELTGHALTTLAVSCPRLLELDVSWIRTVDDEFIDKLISHSRGLKCVKVYGCNRLTEVTMKKALCNSAGHAILVHGNEFD